MFPIPTEGNRPLLCLKKQPLRPEEGRPRRQGPACLVELPRLQLSGGTTLSSYASPALQSMFAPGADGEVPVLRPPKFMGASQKVGVPWPSRRRLTPILAHTERPLLQQTAAQKAVKPNLKQCRLPTIGRRDGGY